MVFDRYTCSLRDGRRVLGEWETMDNDSNLPTLLLLSSRLAPAQRTHDDTYNQQVYLTCWSRVLVLVLLLVYCLLLLVVSKVEKHYFAINYTFIYSRISAKTTRTNIQRWFQAPQCIYV